MDVQTQEQTPQIAVVCIMRNEAANLPRFVASVKGLHDKLVLVDTGSTDNSIEVAKSLGAEVHSIPWEEDFSKARNLAADLALPAEWLFMPDCDMILHGAEQLRSILLKAPDAVNLAVVRLSIEGGAPVWTKRAWRAGKGHWMYVVHEVLQLKGSQGIGYAEDKPIWLEHPHSPGEGSRRRHIEMLRHQIEIEPNNLRYRFVLASELGLQGDWVGSEAEYLKHIECLDRQKEQLTPKDAERLHLIWSIEKAKGLVGAGYARVQRNDFQGAAELFRGSCKVCPQWRDGHVSLAFSTNDPIERRKAAETALSIEPDTLLATAGLMVHIGSAAQEGALQQMVGVLI